MKNQKFLWLTIVFLLTFGIIGIPGAQGASDYTSGVSASSSTSVQFWFKPSGYTAGYVILHYTLSGASQQNVYMTYNSNTAQWEYSLSGLRSGNTMTYNHTYNKNGLQYDSATASYTVGSSSPTGVTFYQDANYGGTAVTLGPGSYTLTQLNAAGIPNDWMSSLKVPGGYGVDVYQNDNFTGTQWSFAADTSYVGAACNDQMSSVIVRASGNYMYNTLVWSDDFDGSALDRANWNYQIGNGYNPGAGSFDGWGNGEWEWYRSDNVSLSNGNLVIKGEYLSTPYVFANRNWYQFSGRITTKGLRSWKFGRVEARIKVPTIASTWPAFWMMGNACDTTVNGASGGYDTLPTNWSSCGEIDIMEHRNAETQFCSNLFWDTRIGVNPWASGTTANNPTWTTGVDETQWHTYAMEWNGTIMKYYLDGTVIKTQDISASNQEEFRQPFFIILNLAISGTFTGPTDPAQANFPCYMYVDYVKVYQ